MRNWHMALHKLSYRHLSFHEMVQYKGVKSLISIK
jgi:hypothetical protein